MPQLQIEAINPEWLSRDPETVKSKIISACPITPKESGSINEGYMSI